MVLNFTRRQWMTVIVISISDFCNAICVALQAPFYPQEAEKKGCSATEYGLVFGIFELVVFLVSPLYGAHLNKLGPKTLFNGGILTTGTCAILFGFLDKVEGHMPFITLSFIIRIVEAMGNAAFLTASFAIIAKEFPNNISTMFASLETFFGLGLIVGPTVGGALYSVGGYTTPFAVLGSVLFGSAVMSYFALPHHPEEEDDGNGGPSMISLLKIPGVFLAAISIICTSMSIGFLQATLEPHLRQFGLTPVILGLMFVINGGIYAGSAPIWGKICDTKGVNPKAVTVLGCAFVAGGFLLVGPAPFITSEISMWMVILGLVLHGLGMACQLVASFSDALKTAVTSGFPNSIETYGLVSGLWTSTFALGAFIGPSISGFLFDTIGFRNSTQFVLALHMLVGLVVTAWMFCDKRQRSYVTIEDEQGDDVSELVKKDGRLDGIMLLGDIPEKRYPKLSPVPIPDTRIDRGLTIEQSRPPGMNSLIACSSFKNRRGPWGTSSRSRFSRSYGSVGPRARYSTHGHSVA